MWPRDFPIPQFSYDVELRLRQGNDEFEKSGKGLKLTRDQKHDILEKLGSTMYDFKGYPDDKQIGKVAEALVTKHPCLKEPGSDTGWNGWKTSLKFKMGNLRNKMRKIGCLEVTVNAGKRSQGHPENEPSHSKIKKPRRSEVNYLPNFPQGEDEASLETVRQEIAVEVQKTEKNTSLIHKNMERTFALRRQNIVSGSPSVNEFLNLWPALRITSELFAEYQRVTNENLPNKFYAQLDYLLPCLMTILRQKASKTGKTADALANLLKVHDEQELHDVNSRRTTVIRGLPVLLRDKDIGFFRTTLIDNPEVLTEDAPVSLLTVVHENAAAPIHYDPVRVSVVLENEVVTTHSQLPEAFLVLFGFMYALHLKYPKGLAKTFEFVQKVLLGMDDGKLSPSVQTLKNELM
ncbi:uncharacterized protein LOC125722345 isoform X1 [Brienomyrus brachyistius]|uniref:uncharacterized protein LOC125722345 isoform X1 n=3 Tax=Brienomyrus brachyistius TaxID=42636 RepID=UPI0020B30B6B|nr:uncharacterized protein LOC125722345 isoform X1 [Brienomyrus brachyistius]